MTFSKSGLLKLEEEGVTQNPTAIWINIMRKRLNKHLIFGRYYK